MMGCLLFHHHMGYFSLGEGNNICKNSIGKPRVGSSALLFHSSQLRLIPYLHHIEGEKRTHPRFADCSFS